MDHAVLAVEVRSLEPGNSVGGEPSALRQWLLVVVLTILGTLAYVDKNVVVLMLKSIQQDLHLSAVQITFAIGTAFAIANLVVGVPAGWLADWASRRGVIWSAVVLWCIMTMFCGFAGSPVLFALARMGVGFAEGLLPPSAYSLIRDGVSPKRRARAFGTFAMATLIGSGIAFLLGGVLVSFASHHDFGGVPLLRHLKPWAVVLFILGAAGLPVSLLTLCLREPARATATVANDRVGFHETLGTMRAQAVTLVPLAIFAISQAMLTNSLNIWMVPLLSARLGLGTGQLGLLIGVLLLTMGPIGLFGAGLVVDRLESRTPNGSAIVAVAVSTILFLTSVVHPVVLNWTVVFVLTCVLMLFANVYQIITSATVAKILAPQITGKAIAIYLVLQGTFGVGLGATITAYVSEHVFTSSALPIAAAMSVVHGGYAAVGVVAAVALYLGQRLTGEKRGALSPRLRNGINSGVGGSR